MGYLSCNAESAIATCDPYNWDRKILRRKKTDKITTTTSAAGANKPTKIREFNYDELVTATGSFSADAFLGKGSHGTVYRASLDDGRLIAAVKKTIQNKYNNSSTTTTAANCTAPADNEIEILSRIHHPRLVNLIGFCSDSNHRKLLVVEYMPNGSLYDLLHSGGDNNNAAPSSRLPGWSRRVRFALQVAKAVQALHSSNPPVIHRDIKSSNVLIDDKWSARLGDFGLALRGHVEDVRVKCTPPAGTLGYLDPGYLAPGDLSTKSDVFSFGILLLEIVSGRNAIDVNYSPPSIVDWAVPLIKRGDFTAICDDRVGCPSDPAVVRNLAVLAARCVRSTAHKRPEMGEVVEGLKCVYKRVQRLLIWNPLRRRVQRVPGPEELEVVAVDESEEAVNVNVNVNVSGGKKTVRMGSRRNSKVSSVSNAEDGGDSIGLVGERVIRSKSIGSFSEIKVKPAGVAVKMPVVRLNKSRSMGVLRSPRLVHCSKKGFVFEFGGEAGVKEKRKETVSGGLLIGLDKKSEEEMQEKPLVSI
ncbi:hypothetical protein Tsubulata_029446 [Turnera subulata]|uniref:Protein kinase domain-containing protein n=1 Tax=Turnera subulata TaxID=218843 RepID=A0A9Q0FBQ7_9ROSI|nr:hypothetical protein Tsubulata_029446 [Turnera subulata]